MATVLTQQTWQDAKQDPQQLGRFLLDALKYGDRGVAGAGNQGYSSWAQIYADLSASGIDPGSIGLPSLEEAAKMPGYNPTGAPTAPVMVGSVDDTAPPAIDPNPPPPADVPIDPKMSAEFRKTKAFLDSVGLGYLAGVDESGAPTGWLWDEVIKKGLTDPAEIQMALDNNADWVERFKPMYEQRKQAANGQGVQILTPAQIREYEAKGAELMRAYNMPSAFFDDYRDFQALMIRGVNATQLEQAITVSWNRVGNAKQEVRDYFSQTYGPMGDSAMASFFLDNAQFDQKLDKISRAASIGGTARGLGIGLGRATSEDLAGMGLEGENARQGLLNIAAVKELFQENFGERDLTEEQGVRGGFGLDAGDAAALKRRRDERMASFSGGGEGAYTSEGLLSARTAR